MKRSSSFTVALLLLFHQLDQTLGNSLLMGLVGRDFVLLAADALVTQSWQVQTVQDPIRVHRNMAFVSTNQRLLDLIHAHAIWMEYSHQEAIGADVTLVKGSTGVIQRHTRPSLQVSTMAQFLRQYLVQQLRKGEDPEPGCLVAGLIERDCNDEYKQDDFFAGQVVQKQLSQVLTSGDPLIPPLPDKPIDTTHEPIVSASYNDDPPYQPCLYWLDAYGSLLNVRYAAVGYASPWMWSWLDQRYRPDMTLSEAIALVLEAWQTLRSSRSYLQSKPCLKYIDAEGQWHVVEC